MADLGFEILQGLLHPIVRNVVVNFADHGIVLVAHPFDKDFHGNVCVAAHGAEGMAEIVGTNGDAVPWRELAFCQELLVRLGFAVPVFLAAVELGFHIGEITVPGTLKGGLSHMAVFGLEGKAVFAGKENAQGRKQRQRTNAGFSFRRLEGASVTFGEGDGFLDVDQAGIKINIPIDIKGQYFTDAQARVEHEHGGGAETMIAQLVDQIAFPLFQRPVGAGGTAGRLCLAGGTGTDQAVVDSVQKHGAKQVFSLGDMGMAVVGKRIIIFHDVGLGDLLQGRITADEGTEGFQHGSVLIVGLAVHVLFVGREPAGDVLLDGDACGLATEAGFLLPLVGLAGGKGLGLGGTVELKALVFAAEASVRALLEGLTGHGKSPPLENIDQQAAIADETPSAVGHIPQKPAEKQGEKEKHSKSDGPPDTKFLMLGVKVIFPDGVFGFVGV